MSGVGEGAERELLEGFSAVSRLFNRLPATSQEVIRDITIKMGDGMASTSRWTWGRARTTMDRVQPLLPHGRGARGRGALAPLRRPRPRGRRHLRAGRDVWPFCA